MGRKIMIVTGEASGDLHGANLVRALQKEEPGLEFCGMGGPELGSVGVDLLFDAEKVSVVGIFEVFSHLKDIFRAQKILRLRLASDPPDLLILIDLPDFNLLLAKKAKKLGIPVFYYICPQVWAWRSGRINTLKKRADRFGVIFPFEEQYFKERGLNARYVGHPLLDSVSTSKTRSEFTSEHNIDRSTKIIGLLPGSRKREVTSLLPVFLEAAQLLQNSMNEKLVFVVPKAAAIDQKIFREAGLDNLNGIDVRLIEGDRYNVMASCDCVVAASGTVTLELALLSVPMVVTYKLSPLTYLLAKSLVKLEFFSLVNLIAGFGAVPELLQDEVEPKTISRELAVLLNAYPRKKKMNEALDLVNQRLGEPGASAKAAQVALELLEEKESGRRV
ncbi:lipid-A-disaccharide synthase [Desulforhopalus sp. IMCC35007]|uniref:lipid-A-disaccharide synthase n=1 Tax=Desulforhopalus sp. IMCC35007 TaxID=2569543 RepID=UPI0010AE560E|nr:lipid-A-disaccharide synthase [Desulforhopalus sp. IMCC35007]TKB11109.1 lipid-A-disaccharide synthase [Desulforhopalus sp. IMCC35007]